MSVAESWQAPDWFSSNVEPAAGVRIILVDGAALHERLLIEAARSAGIQSPLAHWAGEHGGSPALLFEAGELDLAHRQLRSLRADPRLEALPALLSVSADQLAAVDTGGGFDDFVLQPCSPLELRARIRAIEHRRQEAEAAGDPGADGMHVDPVAHEAVVNGRTVRLTAREFALFAYLRARRGHVLSRQHLLSRVWGHRYHGGPRTVDTHIGRLRLKFGAAFPIETVRTNGYRLGSVVPAASATAAAAPSATETPSAAE